MQSFFYLFTRYLDEKAKNVDLYVKPVYSCPSILTEPHRDWDRIKSPAADQIVAYADLHKPQDTSNLNKLAVLKVNGGLGTSMGTCIMLVSS